MKKLLLISLLFLGLVGTPLFVKASIDTNLYYGLRANSEVSELQEFLIDKGFLAGSATGNFYSLTLSAVKRYQASVSIIKTGYVGALTRKSINDTLLADLESSEQESINETGAPVTIIEPVAPIQPVPMPTGATPQISAIATVEGCTDNYAKNFNSNASKDNGSCEYWEKLSASCTPDKQTIKPFERVTFNISATGGDGNYKYSAYFCDNNICSTTSFISEGSYTETVQVKSAGQSTTAICNINIKK